MNLVDMHCDTVSELMKKGTGYTLRDNDGCIDLKGLKDAGTIVQLFACYVDVRSQSSKPVKSTITKKDWEYAWEEVQHLLSRLEQELNLIPDFEIHQAKLFSDIEECIKKGRIAAIATVEEGGILNGKMERLSQLYQRGVRLITLTWNYKNCLGYPNSRNTEIMRKGLTNFGIEVVKQMNQSGMIVDVSHLSDGGFWDCIRESKAPVVASHSNCRLLCGHPRNLTDDMLKALAEKGGVAGLNFYPFFIKEDGKASMSDIACHALHMIMTAGEDVVSVGSDFDGFSFGNLTSEDSGNEYVFHVRDMEKLWYCMKAQGITERQLDKIWSGNALRVMKEIL